MRTVRRATQEEVLECFWSAELASPRWTGADVDARKRDWRDRDGLFGGFPEDVIWERAALTREEVLEILYINWDWWATNPELIVVTDPARSKLVVLEGHVRLTAYAAFPAHLPDELELYLGVSPEISSWSEW